MPREFTNEERTKLNIKEYYITGQKVYPAFELPSWVWINTLGTEETRPTYRFYNAGTNDLKIIKYTPIMDTWERVELKDIPYGELYSMLWRLTLKEFKE